MPSVWWKVEVVKSDSEKEVIFESETFEECFDFVKKSNLDGKVSFIPFVVF